MAGTTWSKVAVSMETALGTAVAATGITKANPAVLAHSGADPTNGAYVVLKTVGMEQVNERVFRVANVSAGVSFELEGENSTNYDTFVSGTFEVVTFGVSFGTIRGVTPSGGDANLVDDSVIHNLLQKQIPAGYTPASYSLENRWDPSDAGLAALNAAGILQVQKSFKFVFANGKIMVLYGYGSAAEIPAGSAQDLVTTVGTIAISNFPTYYAS